MSSPLSIPASRGRFGRTAVFNSAPGARSKYELRIRRKKPRRKTGILDKYQHLLLYFFYLKCQCARMFT